MKHAQKIFRRALKLWVVFAGVLSFLLSVDSFVQSLRQAIRSSRLSLYLVLAGVALLILATVLYFRREMRRQLETHESTDKPATTNEKNPLAIIK